MKVHLDEAVHLVGRPESFDHQLSCLPRSLRRPRGHRMMGGGEGLVAAMEAS